MKKTAAGILAVLASLGIALTAAVADEPLPVDQAFKIAASQGPGGSLEIEWEIAEGYYLYRDRIAARAADGAALTVETPPGLQKDDPNFGPSEIYYGRAEAVLSDRVSNPIEISYQGCQEDGICYAPERRLVDPVTFAITNPTPMTRAQVAWSSEPAVEPKSGLESPGFQLAADEGLVQSLLGKGGIALMLGMFTLFGLLLAFTPCVFPMYPILAGALAREGERLTPGRGFALSAAYVIGLASAFALLGAAAGWSGQNLQMVLQSSWTTGVIVAVFIGLALSMFGLFELQLPSAWTSWIAARTGRRGGSTGSAAALGFSSALIVGPCVTAPLAGALLYIAQTGDTALGAAALFALGIGKGLPLLVLGAFGGKALPRAGAWMEQVKRAFGFAFLGTAIWLATPLVPAGVDLALWAVLLIGVASYAFSAILPRGLALTAGRALGTISLIYGAILMIGAAAGATDPLTPLAVFADRGQASAVSRDLDFGSVTSAADLQAKMDAAGMPTLVYFTADWCVTCRSIERGVLPDAGVREALSGFRLLKADVTDFDARDAELMRQLRVAGPPTMLFFDANAREIAGTRLVGNVSVNSLTASAARLAGY
ncbi:protein-disulfide reductase DsbD [Chelativorans sp. Marseille-P2723]|uniref:protein-disulfide reductase DsbD n=1 Tax=Chelativorans sp. Marseille-P2723 TaxID=2709133 RepID=UPI00156D70E0|nr:protein-disulfide reductase DsbD [Chelativorans sp. Marseille-P2723]